MNLQTFDFNEAPVRVLLRDEQPWFVAADVCRVLEIANSRDAVSGLDEDEKATVGNTDSRPGAPGAKSYQIISESGLYALVFKSRKPEAKKFRKWVTSEVLPVIRQTGQYRAAEAGACTVQRSSLLTFVRTRGAEWPLTRKIQFGLLARRYAKAMGVVQEVVPDAEMGAVLTFPTALLDDLGVHFALQLPAAVGDDLRLVEALAAALIEKQPEGGWVSTRDLWALAVKRGLWAKKDNVMALGRALSRYVGRRVCEHWSWHSAATAKERGWKLEAYAPG